jgi:hypothetical protein
MVTDTPDPNSPEAVLEYLREPLSAIHLSMDDGVSFADGVVDDQPWNPHVWATLVRYRALNILNAVEDKWWGLGRKLPNCGISLKAGPFTGRLLKAQGGDPPAPGRNLARRRYWSQYQQLSMPLSPMDSGIDPLVGANLIIDWDVSADRRVLLALSKPAGIWKYQGNPDLEWRHPIVVEGNEMAFEGQDDGVDVEPRYELGELKGDFGE